MKKRWVLKDSPDEVIVNQLAEELSIPTILSQLLVQRGVSTFDEAKLFFRPSLSDLHNPFDMKDMDKAVLRIEQAIQKGERILIYGDYDVDGTTAVAMLFDFISTVCTKIDYYIPDRYSEGYGISFKGIDFAHENNINLIIALDCGIKSNDKIDYANQKGIDFIICDHHRPGLIIPEAIAVLDPKREDCNYPFKELTGCGIGFKLIQAFAQKNNIAFSELNCYLDLVAVSIAADIVPIVGENRILAHFGLLLLNKNPRIGFQTMIEMAGTKKEKDFTISDIVFIIAPRINAAGRLYNGKKAVELLLTKIALDALEFGKNLNDTNTERKNLDKIITDQAIQLIENNSQLMHKKSTVVFQNDWHKGIVGIVASRLIEKFYRPTIVLTESNGMATGSARSVKNFDVYNAIEACAELLEQFGGHKYAAGLTLKLENLEAFQNKFESVVASSIEEDWLTPEIEIDSEINFDEIDAKFFRILKQFAPFGPENMLPIFLSKNVTETGFTKVVGNNHLKFDARQNGKSKSFPCIAFGLADKLITIKNATEFDMCFTIDENEWNGNIKLQLNVKDIRP